MKVALITTHNVNNYGAILQAFALQKVLSRSGQVDIINYDNRHLSVSMDLIRIKLSVHGLLGAGKDVFRVFPRYAAIKRFEKFVDENINLTRNISKLELDKGDLAEYDVYVAGSDQIWNPTCVSKDSCIDSSYFLSFAPESARKISYASSVGGYKLSSKDKIRFKKLLQSFHRISVREKDTQALLQEIMDREILHVLDPTLLLSRAEWMSVVGHVNPFDFKEKYILLYTVPKIPLIRKAVDFFSKKMNLKVIALDQGLSAGAKVDLQIRRAGPLEFLGLFSDAEFVITDSFHGTCFAVNFQIPFISISLGAHSNRIMSLLSILDLEERLVHTEEQFVDVELFQDYKQAHKNLYNARLGSLNFLDSALKGL